MHTVTSYQCLSGSQHEACVLGNFLNLSQERTQNANNSMKCSALLMMLLPRIPFHAMLFGYL